MGRDFGVFCRTIREKKIGEDSKAKIDAESEEYESDSDEEFPIRYVSSSNDVIWEIVYRYERYFEDDEEVYDLIKTLINKFPEIEERRYLQRLLDEELLSLAKQNYEAATYTKGVADEEKKEDILDELRILKIKRNNIDKEIQDTKEAIAVFGVVATMTPIWVKYN